MSHVYFSEDELPIKKGIKPCPICGETDGIYINGAKHYNALVKEHGSACLKMGCKRCYLELYVFNFITGNKKYADMKKALIDKWNTRNYKEEES